MHLIVDLAKTTLMPGSITAIIFAFTPGVVLLYLKPRWGRVWLTCVTLGYWLVSTPAGTSLLARTVSTNHQPLQTPASAQGATAVVMLGGGSNNVIARGRQLTSVTRSSALRAIETARVYHLLGDPVFDLTPVVEAFGWTFLDGQKINTALDGTGIESSASGDTIVNVSAGMRMEVMGLGDFYAGYAHVVTGSTLYRDIWRFEWRVTY